MEILIVIFYLLLVVIGLPIWIWMLVSACRGRFKSDADKYIWIAVLLITGIPGAIIYWIAKKGEVDRNNASTMCPNCKLLRPKVRAGKYRCSRCAVPFCVESNGETWVLR
jgi:hypothetical protein